MIKTIFNEYSGSFSNALPRTFFSGTLYRIFRGWFLLWLVFSPALLPGSPSNDSTQAIITKELYHSHQTRIKGYPYIYYTPETALAIGAGGIATFYTSRELILRPSKISLSGYYSTRKQYKISLTPQLYMLKNRIFLSGNINFGDFVDKFWGIGSQSPNIEHEDYDSRAWGILVNFQFPPILKFMPQNKSGIIYDYYHYIIRDARKNPFLREPETVGRKGGISSGFGLTMVWDTRNHIFYPTQGGFYQIKTIFYLKPLGSSTNFNNYEIDLRHYFGMRKWEVLAVQIFASFATGNPPFYELPMLGGANLMRGYYQGRYRDHHFMSMQMEYRTHVWWRFGAVAFVALGDVSPTMRQFRIRYAKVSGGFGFRFLFNQEEWVNVRMDVGFGRGTSGVYFGMEEAF